MSERSERGLSERSERGLSGGDEREIPTVYPVNLVLEGRSCLVVGGGAVARRKVEGLVAVGAVVDVVAPEIDAAIEAMPGVSVHRRPYTSADVTGRHLVIAAVDDPAVGTRVFCDAEAAGVWVNVADDPRHCTFVLPAVARAGSVTIAVGTGGRSPALAGWLRDELAAHAGPEISVLADLLAAERGRLHDEGRSSEGLDWRGALDSDMLDLIRAGQVHEARERLQACLSSSSA